MMIWYWTGCLTILMAALVHFVRRARHWKKLYQSGMEDNKVVEAPGHLEKLHQEGPFRTNAKDEIERVPPPPRKTLEERITSIPYWNWERRNDGTIYYRHDRKLELSTEGDFYLVSYGGVTVRKCARFMHMADFEEGVWLRKYLEKTAIENEKKAKEIALRNLEESLRKNDG